MCFRETVLHVAGIIGPVLGDGEALQRCYENIRVPGGRGTIHRCSVESDRSCYMQLRWHCRYESRVGFKH